MSDSLALRRVTAHVYRYPLETPVQTSFGIMRDRPMVVVEVEDAQGARGYGEVWCNFPAVGAEHRARLVTSVLAPLLTARPFADAAQAFAHMTEATAVLALQSAEPGPFAQAIAGVDIALWDLAARKASQPLWRHLDASASPVVGVYASGLNPTGPEALAAQKRSEGYRAFKLKIGFGLDRDLRNLSAVREAIGPECALMADANQAWDLETAVLHGRELDRHGLAWLEEPLRCDRPWPEWQALSGSIATRLAAGENMQGTQSFAEAVASRAFGVLQPDMAKWGGFSATLPVARSILAAGLRFCPHYLGGGIGLLASAHLLAAAEGDGLLEIDANPNPLRSELCGPLNDIRDGRATLTEAPGLGPVPLTALERYRVPVAA
ncbi:MAG: mandelate racemase/muconate lactonizing enzyme family protein [Hyphomicrobiales bacterium]|nr:MAG: mandelate racemase/muconate lactonizing enzyme family protein [Hyphomicrobiales bacterium]